MEIRRSFRTSEATLTKSSFVFQKKNQMTQQAIQPIEEYTGKNYRNPILQTFAFASFSLYTGAYLLLLTSKRETTVISHYRGV